MTEWLSKRTHGQIVVFQVCRKVISGGHNLTELTGQYVGLMPPFFGGGGDMSHAPAAWFCC